MARKLPPEIRKVFSQLGIHKWHLERRSKHIRLVFFYRGHRGTATLAVSPGDRRTVTNSVGDIKRFVRRTGRGS